MSTDAEVAAFGMSSTNHNDPYNWTKIGLKLNTPRIIIRHVVHIMNVS